MSVADWRPYYDATERRPPRPTLLRALAGFAAEGRGPGLRPISAAELGVTRWCCCMRAGGSGRWMPKTRHWPSWTGGPRGRAARAQVRTWPVRAHDPAGL